MIHTSQPEKWSAVSLKRTAPIPVQGEPLRRMADLVEIARIDLVEARLGKAQAEQFGRGGEMARELGYEIAVAIDPIAIAAQGLHPHDTRHGEQPSTQIGAPRLDVDDITAAEDAPRQFGNAARQEDPAARKQRHPIAYALHLIEVMRRQQNRGAVGLQP